MLVTATSKEDWLPYGGAMSVKMSSGQRPVEDDSYLIKRVALERDSLAFRSLFLRFGPRVKAIMMKSGADAETAEDLAQEAMLVVWRKADRYAPERGSLAAWIFTIARNLRIDRLRRQSPEAYEDIDELELEAPEESGETQVQVRQRNELVLKAVAELPPDQRSVIEMSFVHDTPQSDIAQKLGLPLGTVKSRTRLAYIKLRERLEALE